MPSNLVTSPTSSSSCRNGLASTTLSADHRRLGHPSLSVIESVFNKIVCALPSESSVCDLCQHAKVHRRLIVAIHLLSSSTPICGRQLYHMWEGFGTMLVLLMILVVIHGFIILSASLLLKNISNIFKPMSNVYFKPKFAWSNRMVAESTLVSLTTSTAPAFSIVSLAHIHHNKTASLSENIGTLSRRVMPFALTPRFRFASGMTHSSPRST